ncbi:uncharacterized protein UTRI_01486_B [Ustilago trichophora]|uniref:Poly(A) RNA polymerase mitochondrial-like central palm domain-containing protein n=1 Tax=Ustilago trichophora TaxID=86804 RepID=A0A5C3E4H7_9BASI|nr:uncharacterized protein UTRI_01486_B [Ustilago trichophora]
MDVPLTAAQDTPFADVSFLDSNLGQPQTTPGPFSQKDMQTIDFSASQAYFSGLESSRSPLHVGSPSHVGGYGYERDTSFTYPNSAISGLDPVSKLGFTSNRAFMRPHSGTSGSGDAGVSYSSHQPLNGSPQLDIPIKPAYAPQSPGRAPRPEAEASTSTHQQRNLEAAHRVAEVERRNRLREEEKERRKLAIQKQVDDGMAALRFEKDQVAQRSAEVERRNKLREEEKANRRLAIQKQVEDGIKAIQLEKKRQRARVEEDRMACRKWLSDLSHAPGASSSAADDANDTTIDVYTALGRQLRGFWQDSRPAASSQAQRNEVISDVQRAITHKWPDQGLQVAAFGSSVTGLVTESSDLDLVLLDPTRPYGVGTPPELRRDPNNFVRHSGGMPEWYSTHQIANAIRASNKFRSVVSIGGANVPIVKMIHRKYDIPADININERFGLFNSQLISAYANLQPDLVRPLIFFLKHWYSRRQLNDPAGKRGSMTFSSYTIALMALQVLQVEGVLPNLQSPDLLNSLNIRPNFLYSRVKRPHRRGNNGRPAPSEDFAPLQKYNVTFAASQVDAEPYRRKALEVAGGGEYRKDRLLGKMLASFLRFYQQLDRHTQIVSVVNGSPLQRRKKSQPRHVFFDSASEDGFSELNGEAAQHLTEPMQRASRDAEGRAALREEQADLWAGDELVVQDPFIIDRNTSRNIKSQAIERWQSEMENAIHVLGLHKSGEASKVRLEHAPLVLDLCIPQNVVSDMEADGHGVQATALAGTETASEEPWRPEEEAAAQAREIAVQAAQSLRREKKKRARRSKRSEARLLQEEAAMVEDMIDGIETGRVTGLMSGSERHEIWRLRTDNDPSNGGNSTAIPFTFSVARIHTPKKTDPVVNGDAKLSPTMSIATTRANASASSEDIDLVALRLERDVRV